MSENEKGKPVNVEEANVENPEGESIAFGMAIKDNVLIIDFGQPIAWIGLTKTEVVSLRDELNKKINLLF